MLRVRMDFAPGARGGGGGGGGGQPSSLDRDALVPADNLAWCIQWSDFEQRAAEAMRVPLEVCTCVLTYVLH